MPQEPKLEAGEILAFLVPHPVQFDYVPGGLRKLTSTEMAGVLSGLPKEQYALIVGVELGDHSAYQALKTEALLRLSDHHLIKARRRLKAGTLQQMVDLAYHQLSSPKVGLCSKCRGRQNIPNLKGVLVPCDGCDGTGKKKMSKREQARLMGMNDSTWRKEWFSLYEKTVYDMMTRWLNTARHHVERNFYG